MCVRAFSRGIKGSVGRRSHRMAIRRDREPGRRALAMELLEVRCLLSAGLRLSGASGSAQAKTLADLPVAAQHVISSAIGQDQSAYHATSDTAGMTLANPANGFTAQVDSGSLHVAAGSDTWDMSLVGLGYGGAVQPVGTAETLAKGNRVDCNYGTIDEWYVNGPGGLEQGFKVAPLPQGASGSASASLTVELALGGNLMGTVNAAGNGLTLTRPDGSAALGYTGLTACDATGKTLPASLEVRAEGGRPDLLIHVDAAGAKGRITIDPFVEEAKLTASDGAAADYFGTSISISGDTAVVGAPCGAEDGKGGDRSGRAYVFTNSASGWTQAARLTASDGAAYDDFGNSVSISGNTVVVGANGFNINQGAAYVFTEPGTGWANMTQAAKLTASDDLVLDNFGSSVSISGNTVVVGATGSQYPTGGGLRVHGVRLRLDSGRQAHRIRWRDV